MVITTPKTEPVTALEHAVRVEYDNQRAAAHAARIALADAQIRVDVAHLRIRNANKAMAELAEAGVSVGDDPYLQPTLAESRRYVAQDMVLTDAERTQLGWPARGEGDQ